VCDLETSRIGAAYIYDISSLRVKHPPPFSAEVKERVELYLYFPFGPSYSVLRGNYI
jgi:hypothetical protein